MNVLHLSHIYVLFSDITNDSPWSALCVEMYSIALLPVIEFHLSSLSIVAADVVTANVAISFLCL